MAERGRAIALYRLQAADSERRAVEAGIVSCVRRAREAGATWAQIGEALSVSRQQAHRKYAPLV